jgi:hypothetical protein
MGACELCEETDISPDVEAFEVTGMILCSLCGADVLADHGQFGVGA